MFPRRMHAQFAALFCLVLIGAAARGNGTATPLPLLLSETGLYDAGSVTAVRADNLPFTPQYPLWSDGAAKRRWLHIPPETSIDASRFAAWNFPRGTKLWKEFSHGRRIETRLIERLAAGTWRYATYVWNEQETDAVLAPAAGISALPVTTAPNGRYAIPSEADCRACHEGGAVPVLGVSALQLSPDRDPLAPHTERRRANEVGLGDLAARGWLRNLPPALLEDPPRIAAASPTERAALGYLHGNCGHCHNSDDAAPPVNLVLAQGAGGSVNARNALRTLIGAPSRYRVTGLQPSARLIEPGHPGASVLAARMKSRNPQVQMPPIGTRIPDVEALALIERWIVQQPPTAKELQP